MTTFKLFLIYLWLALSCVVGFFACLFIPFGVDPTALTANLFSWLALKICRTTVTYTGLENLYANTPCIYVCNHQSGMDMATFGAIYPLNTKIIAKSELRFVPVFGFFLWFAGHIFINRSKKSSAISGLDKAVAAIRKRRVSIWIFPEGTRNKTGQGLLPFKKGAFHMAIAAGIPVVPLVSSNIKDICIWENRFIQGGHVTITVLPAISTQGMTKNDVESLRATVHQKMLDALEPTTLPPSGSKVHG